MPCRVVHTPLGHAIICSRGAEVRRCACGRPARYRCDYALRGRRAGDACGKPLCERCRHESAVGDLCRVHAELVEREQREVRADDFDERVLELMGVRPLAQK